MATRAIRTTGEVLADVRALVDELVACPAGSDAERLAAVAETRKVSGQLMALSAVLACQADADETALRAHGTSLATWLAATQTLTRREAHRLIGQGRDLTRFPEVARRTLSGDVGFEQALAISSVLSRLPGDLGPEQTAQAERTMLGFADEFDSAGLAGLSRHLLEVIDPDGSDERDAKRLERDLRQARAARHLVFSRDGHGSLHFRGSLPVVDAEPLVRLVEAYAEQGRRRALDRVDPLAEVVTPAMRRADGLCALVAAHQQESLAPSCNGDRPRLVVTVSLESLRGAVPNAEVAGSSDRLTPGQLRQIACDAEVLPVVLGGRSEVLDVGRAQRLVTPAIRTALTLRDGGCVFPGCDKTPGECHAHHLVPWYAGGRTSLDNLVLVCPHHHNLIEPAREGPPGRRWEAVIDDDGWPAILPPAYVDPRRRPRHHQRFRLRSERGPDLLAG